MQKQDSKDETVSPALQELVRSMFSAIRAVRLYPSNNPLYRQTIHKSHAHLETFLRDEAALLLEVHRSDVLYKNISLGKSIQAYAGIVSDLFSRGVREISLMAGVTESELHDLFDILTLSQEDLQLRGSTESLLWERGVSHIAVKDASLDAVVTTSPGERSSEEIRSDTLVQTQELGRVAQSVEIHFSGRTAVLSDLVSNPAGFGTLLLETARQTGGTRESQETRLMGMYREVGHQLLEQFSEHREPLFEALAKSVFSLEPEYRDGLISQRLYAEFDRQTLQERMADARGALCQDVHEVITGRFSRSCSVPQVSSLLQKAAAAAPETESRAARGDGETVLSDDLQVIARELSEYTPEEMESLKKVNDAGLEEDTLNAVVTTLINLLPLARQHAPSEHPEERITACTRVVSLLEDILIVLLDRKIFSRAAEVLRALRTPGDPALSRRLAEAVKKAGDHKRIADLIHTMQTTPKGSADYQAISSYLSLLDREATPVLLEKLSVEEDRSTRRFLVQILKDLGKNQIALLGERLSDERWYFVRNIIGILGESRKEEVIEYLKRVSGHRNFQIRQEVVRALVSIGGRKAAALLGTFLRDKDIDIRFMAVRGLGTFTLSGEREERVLMDFLARTRFRKSEQELKRETMESLGKIGGPAAAQFLKKHTKLRWWKERNAQVATRTVARKAIADIERRYAHARRG